jgi:hypothetical protein
MAPILTPAAGGDLGLGGLRLAARVIGQHADEAVQPAVQSCDAVEPAFDEFDWR